MGGGGSAAPGRVWEGIRSGAPDRLPGRRRRRLGSLGPGRRAHGGGHKARFVAEVGGERVCQPGGGAGRREGGG